MGSQTPTTTNYAVWFPTCGEIAGVSASGVQWTNLDWENHLLDHNSSSVKIFLTFAYIIIAVRSWPHQTTTYHKCLQIQILYFPLDPTKTPSPFYSLPWYSQSENILYQEHWWSAHWWFQNWWFTFPSLFSILIRIIYVYILFLFPTLIF